MWAAGILFVEHMPHATDVSRAMGTVSCTVSYHVSQKRAPDRGHPVGAGPHICEHLAEVGGLCLSSGAWVRTLGPLSYAERLIQVICPSGPSPGLPWGLWMLLWELNENQPVASPCVCLVTSFPCSGSLRWAELSSPGRPGGLPLALPHHPPCSRWPLHFPLQGLGPACLTPSWSSVSSGLSPLWGQFLIPPPSLVRGTSSGSQGTNDHTM